MKKFSLFSLLLLAGISFSGNLSYTPVSGATDPNKISITQIQVSDRARYTASDLMSGQSVDISNIQNVNVDSIDKQKVLQNLGTLGLITFTNSTAADIGVKLKVEIRTSIEGLVAAFKTDPVLFPIVVPANGTKVIGQIDSYTDNQFAQDLSSQSPYNVPSSRYDSLANAAVLQYTQTGELVPPRTYTITVYVLSANNEAVVYYAAEASIYQPGVSGRTTQIMPASGEQIPMSNIYPKFMWTTDVRTGVNLSYTYSLYDYKETDSLVSAVSGIPKFSMVGLNSNNLDYPFSGPSFEMGKKYAWKIDTYDGTGRYLSTVYDWFQYQVPRPANLNAPLGEVTNFPVLFSWTGVEGADHYQVWVSTRKEFTDYKTYETDGVAFSVNNDDAYFEPGKSYFWKVEAINKAGEKYVANPQIGSFLYNQRLDLIRPVDTQVMVLPPQFQWNALPGAQAYQLIIADNPSFVAVKDFIVDQTSYQPDASDFFAFDKTYYWKVQALSNTGGKWGLQSNPASFKSPQREIPYIMAPLGDELPNLTQVQFSWQNVNWAKSYEVQVADNREMKNAKSFKSEASPLLALNSDAWMQWAKTYYWQVLPYDELNQNYSKKSEIGSFKTLARKAPALISPLGEEIANLTTIGFNWEKVLWASKYQLLIADNRDMNSAKIIDAFPPFNWQNDGLVKLGKTYFWQVIPVDDQAQSFGLKSDIGTFRSKPILPIELSTPAGELYDVVKDVLVKWTPIEGAAQYQILLGQDESNLQNATIFYSANSPFTIPADKLKTGVKYVVRVVALDKEGQVFGPGSKLGSFYIKNEEVQSNKPAVVIYPVGKINELNPVIKWTDVVSADSYQVALIAERDGAQAKVTVKGKEVEMTKLMSGRPGDTYRVAVQALDASGKAYLDNSKESAFTLPLPAIKLTDPVGKPVAGKDVKFTWKGDKLYDEYKVIVGKAPNFDGSKTATVKEQQYELKGLDLGAYLWQVVGIWKGEEIFKTDPVAFAVVPAFVSGKINLIDPVNKNIRDNKVVFVWSPVEGIDEYKLRIGKGIDDIKEYKSKGKSYELLGLESGNYNWQVVGVKDNRDVMMSPISGFKFEYVATSGNQVVSGDQTASENAKPTYVKATPQDLAKFAEFVKDYLKANGAANLMEGMSYDDLAFDTKKDDINNVTLQELIEGSTEIKFIKVR